MGSRGELEAGMFGVNSISKGEHRAVKVKVVARLGVCVFVCVCAPHPFKPFLIS